MKFVKATSASAMKNIKIKELGRVAHVGETFWVSDERFIVLNGSNKYRLVFVTLVDSDVNNVVTKTTKKVEDKKVEVKKPEEDVEIVLIKPGEKPVKVNDKLEPITEEQPVEEVKQEEVVVEESVVEEAPKKRRGRKKKSTSEASE